MDHLEFFFRQFEIIEDVIREDVRGVAAATPFFQVLLHKLGPNI